MWVGSLDQEDALEEERATHSSILAKTIPWTEEPGGLQSWGHKQSDTTEQLNTHIGSHGLKHSILANTHQGQEACCERYRTDGKTQRLRGDETLPRSLREPGGSRVGARRPA